MCLRSCNADADMLPGQPNKFTISPVFPNPKFITFFLGKFILISPLPSCRWCTADTAPLPSPCPLCTSALPLHFLQLLLPLHISYSTSLYYPLHCSSPTALSTTSSTTHYLPYLKLSTTFLLLCHCIVFTFDISAVQCQCFEWTLDMIRALQEIRTFKTPLIAL